MRPQHLLVLAMALAISGCNSREPAQEAPAVADPAHGSRNSIDWAGSYEGVLPCGDCPGIRTRLTLGPDESYELSTLHIDRDSEPSVVRGRFSWQPNGNAITLEAGHGGQQFAVGEGRVALLAEGAQPSWPQPEQQVLQRAGEAPMASVQDSLESHRWTLTSASNAQGQPVDGLAVGAEPAVVFQFADGRLNVEGGCNRLFGGYQVDGGNRLLLSPMASTMMACDPAAMQVDAALAELLAGPVQIELAPGADPVLTMVAGAGARLAFQGRMTPQAQYGQATRVFLEVDAQTVACANPISGADTCLSARELRFDEQGLPEGTPGEWQPLHEAIEGYTHEPGIRNVLRLERFDRGEAAGEPRYVYVLDLVVQSEVVPGGQP